MGNGGSGVGNGEWGLGADSRQPIEDNRCGNQLSAIRLPLSEFAYYFFK